MRGDRTKATIEYYESTEGRNYLTSLYRDRGLTDAQAAEAIGVSRRTLHNWRKKSKIIADAVQLGKNTVDVMVENRLLQEALGGNVTAMIFWLQNRKPDHWRDRRAEKAQKADAIAFTFNREDVTNAD